MAASRELQLLESNKGSFYNQANWIEEYEYYKGLYYSNYGDERSDKNNSNFLVNTVILIALLYNIREKYYCIHKYAGTPNNLNK